MYGILLLLAGIGLVVGLVLFWLARRESASLGLPGGEVVYSDTRAWKEVTAPLFSRRYQVAGKPDYLVRTRAGLIPVEVKNRPRPAQPYASHILQLGVYCLLVEDTNGRRPPYGLLHYRDATLQIPYDDNLRAQVLRTVSAVRRALTANNVDRDHDDARRCRFCGFAHACEQALFAPRDKEYEDGAWYG